MAHGDAWEGKWMGNRQLERVATTLALYLVTWSIHGLPADPHSLTASGRLNWLPCQFKWTCPFLWKTKSGFCACAITFHTCSTTKKVGRPASSGRLGRGGDLELWYTCLSFSVSCGSALVFFWKVLVFCWKTRHESRAAISDGCLSSRILCSTISVIINSRLPISHATRPFSWTVNHNNQWANKDISYNYNLAINRDGSMWTKTNSSSLSFFQLLHIPDYINLGHILRLPLFWVWHCITGDWFLMFWDCWPVKQHHTQEQKAQLHYYKKLKTHVENFNRLHSIVLWHSNISTCTAVKHNKLLLNSSVTATCFLSLRDHNHATKHIIWNISMCAVSIWGGGKGKYL